jgi:hypothetical protein
VVEPEHTRTDAELTDAAASLRASQLKALTASVSLLARLVVRRDVVEVLPELRRCERLYE